MSGFEQCLLAPYGSFTLHGTGTGTGTGAGTGTGNGTDMGLVHFPVSDQCEHFYTIYRNPFFSGPVPGPDPNSV